MASAQDRWFDSEQIGDVTVVRFTSRGIWDDEVIKVVGNQLFSLVEEGHHRLLLDMGQVDSMASMMLSKIILLHKKTRAAGGRLALCKVNPRLLQIFEMLKLTKLLSLYDEEGQGMASFT